MPELTVIRVSSLPMYADCPRRAAARMFRKEIEAAGFALRDEMRGIGAAVGTAVHKAAAVTLDEKARSGSLPPVDVATDAAAETIREEIANGVQFDARVTQNPNDAQNQVVRMSRAYHYSVAPEIEPIMVEERLSAEISQGLVLSGQPDLIAREPNRIVDLKTGTQAGNFNAQLGGYSLIARSNQIDIDEAAIDFVQRASMKKPQPEPVHRPAPIAIAEQTAANVVRHIAEDLRVFREGAPERRLLPGDPAAFLANPNSMLCGDKYCPAHSTGPNGWCREHIDKEIE